MSADVVDHLIAQAMAVPIVGWDFSWLDGRVLTDSLPWDYAALADGALVDASAALDVDTGGGELLATFCNRPPVTVATEGHWPNLDVARARLEPLGVEVREHRTGRLPANGGEFDLVLNRHARLDGIECARALRPGGRLLTQQVGGDNESELTAAFGGPARPPWNLTIASDQLRAAGFTIESARQAAPAVRYTDVGAVVYQLRAIPWQVPGFSPVTHRGALQSVADVIDRGGAFVTHQHRFLIAARLRT